MRSSSRLSSVVTFALGAILSVAVFAAPNGGVYGTWGGLPEMHGDNGLTLSMSLKLDPGQVTALNSCKYADGVTVPVSVTVPAQYTESTIQILASGSNQNVVNGHSCQVSVQPGTLNYVLNGDSLTLSGNGQTFTLKRIGF